MIRVLLADDHVIFRRGLCQIIGDAEGIEVAGEASSGAEILQLARTLPADVLVLDISLGDRNGLDILKQVKREIPRLAVLMLSMHSEDKYALRALRAGAAGYLNKQTAPAQLISAIERLAHGRKYISQAVAEQLAMDVDGDSNRAPHETLSDREYETFMLIVSGMPPGEIAEKLHLSIKTISVYRARLLEKLRVKNNVELTHYAMRHLLVE